jgi:hypothetical protein
VYTVAKDQSINNLRKVYLTIREKTNEILSKYDDVDYSKNPSVDIDIIKNIAKENGITDILYVPSKEIYYFHAILEKNAENINIIKINKDDSEEEQLFSIAHEIEHHIKKNADAIEKADIFKNADSGKQADIFKQADMFTNPDKLAARYSVSNYKEAVRIVKKSKRIARYMAETASEKLGKNVSIEQVFNVLAKVICTYIFREDPVIKNSNELYILNLLLRGSAEQFIINMVNILCDEEIADYFAANLLVPTERFLLWEGKSDSKIAEAFKVSKACIKKRREEIKRELEIISLINISSGDNNE